MAPLSSAWDATRHCDAVRLNQSAIQCSREWGSVWISVYIYNSENTLWCSPSVGPPFIYIANGNSALEVVEGAEIGWDMHSLSLGLLCTWCCIYAEELRFMYMSQCHRFDVCNCEFPSWCEYIYVHKHIIVTLQEINILSLSITWLLGKKRWKNNKHAWRYATCA